MSAESPPPRRSPGRAGVAFLLGLAVGGLSVYYLLWRTGALVEDHPASRRPRFDLLGSQASPPPTPEPTRPPSPPPALAPSPILPSIPPDPTPQATRGAP